MRREPLFRKPERWVLRPPPASLLWMRIPTDKGPIDIWLPPGTDTEELVELAIPTMMEIMGAHAGHNDKADDFYRRRRMLDEFIGPTEDDYREAVEGEQEHD